jgi:hypothetical protein
MIIPVKTAMRRAPLIASSNAVKTRVSTNAMTATTIAPNIVSRVAATTKISADLSHVMTAAMKAVGIATLIARITSSGCLDALVIIVNLKNAVLNVLTLRNYRL